MYFMLLLSILLVLFKTIDNNQIVNEYYTLIRLSDYYHLQNHPSIKGVQTEQSIEEADKLYEKSFPYTEHTLKDPKLHHIANEKAIVNLYTKYSSTKTIRNITCSSLSSFFYSNKNDLFIPCNDNRQYSFCQEAYIFRFNSSTGICEQFYRMPYHNHGFDEVSLMTQFSLNRIDRLPFILQRWKGPISLCLVLTESDVDKLDSKLSPFMNKGIVFTFYIAKEYPDHQYHGYYIRDVEKGIIYNYTTMIYPVNFARDLAQESITTTHYLFIDGDFLVSESLYDNIHSFSSMLEKPKTILYLPVFQVHKSILNDCRKKDNCESLWNKLPSTKEKLREGMNSNFIQYFFNPFRHIIDVPAWLKIDKKELLPFKPDFKRHYEPYLVLRRSAYTPISHPYFIDYGFNFIELHERMKSNNYSYYIMSMDFGVDIPHQRTSIALKYVSTMSKDKVKDNIMMTQFNQWEYSYNFFL